jgi:flagellin
MWNAIIQQLNSTAQIVAGTATNTTRQILDQYGNTVSIVGLLNAETTQGGSFTSNTATPASTAVGGSQSSTGLTGFGQAVAKYFPAATSAGNSNSGGQNATMSVTAGQFTVAVSSATNVTMGMGVAGYGIPAGSTITNVSGTTLTFSNTAGPGGAPEPATETGTGVPVSIWLWAQL